MFCSVAKTLRLSVHEVEESGFRGGDDRPCSHPAVMTAKRASELHKLLCQHLSGTRQSGLILQSSWRGGGLPIYRPRTPLTGAVCAEAVGQDLPPCITLHFCTNSGCETPGLGGAIGCSDGSAIVSLGLGERCISWELISTSVILMNLEHSEH